jgi:hypothetical protein
VMAAFICLCVLPLLAWAAMIAAIAIGGEQ